MIHTEMKRKKLVIVVPNTELGEWPLTIINLIIRSNILSKHKGKPQKVYHLHICKGAIPLQPKNHVHYYMCIHQSANGVAVVMKISCWFYPRYSTGSCAADR